MLKFRAFLSRQSLINEWTLKGCYCWDDYTEKDQTCGAYATKTVKKNGIKFQGMIRSKQSNNIFSWAFERNTVWADEAQGRAHRNPIHQLCEHALQQENTTL
jgi:hypothetical protein